MDIPSLALMALFGVFSLDGVVSLIAAVKN